MPFHPGDIVEIDTDSGLAYVLVTHDHASYPTVVSGLATGCKQRPDNLDDLAKAGAYLFTVMIPLEAALRKLGHRGALVRSITLPPAAARFPTFRMPIRDKQGNIVYWWFWDGRGLSYSVDLDEEQSVMPLREVTSAGRFGDLLAGA